MNLEPQRRVAFVDYNLNLGGSSIFVLNLATELKRRGFACHVFTLHPLNMVREELAAAGLSVSYGATRAGSIHEDRLASVWHGLRDFKPSLVIVAAGVETSELLRYLPKGLPRIVIYHMVLDWYLALAQTYRSWIDVAVPVAKRGAEELRRLIPEPPPRVHCIELGIERPKIHRAPPAEGAPLRILYLGRLEESAKRVRLLPRIYSQLKAAEVPFIWTIAGDGPQRAEIEMQMPGGPGFEVTFLGSVSRQRVADLLSSHDIFLLTSDTEAYPLGLHEAMAAGLVPVASAIPGRVCEIVTPATGVSVEIEDVDGYARGIVALHVNRADLAAKSHQARLAIGEECTIHGMANRWLELLTPLLVNSIAWPAKMPPVQAPIGSERPWRFSTIGRVLRRFAARFFNR